MKTPIGRLAILFLSPLLGFVPLAAAQQSSPVHLVKTVTLPGYSGDFDHSTVDLEKSRILLAAEDHGTLEVFDLKTGDHLNTIKGFTTPHSILIQPGSPTILVTDSGPTMTQLIDSSSYEPKQTVKLMPGADSIGFDRASKTVYIVTGGEDVKMQTAGLAAVEPATGKTLATLALADNHVEAMAVEQQGNRIFLNLTQTNQLAVIDKKTLKLIAKWKVLPARENAMAALDEDQHRLYIVCRRPGTVIVYNTDDGKVIATAPAPGHSDDALLDKLTHRLYVPGGDGFLSIYDTSDANKIKPIAKVATALGAKTGLLLPTEKRLMLIASPGESKAVAKILFYDVR